MGLGHLVDHRRGRLTRAPSPSTHPCRANHRTLTCEPIQARVIRQEPFSFCPTALHAFGINDALAWGRAFDSGVANRLIQIAFTDPPKHPIDHIEEKISEQELPLLVAHALAGARQMHQQNWTYSRLISSEELADEQQIEGKPVHVWVAEMVSLDTSAGDVPVKAAHRAFQAWYEERKHMIRQTIPLGDRAFSRAFLSALRTVHNFDARNPRHGDARTYRGVKIGWPDTGPMLRWRREGED